MKKVSMYHGFAYFLSLLLFVWVADIKLGLLPSSQTIYFYVAVIFQFVGLLSLLAVIWKCPSPEEVKPKEEKWIKSAQLLLFSPSIFYSMIAFSIITYNQGIFLFIGSVFLIIPVLFSLWMTLSIIEIAFNIKFTMKDGKKYYQ